MKVDDYFGTFFYGFGFGIGIGVVTAMAFYMGIS
jgi:uncharacterized membrane protein YfhO